MVLSKRKTGPIQELCRLKVQEVLGVDRTLPLIQSCDSDKPINEFKVTCCGSNSITTVFICQIIMENVDLVADVSSELVKAKCFIILRLGICLFNIRCSALRVGWP